MSKTLEYWRIRESFSLSESALLIMNEYPDDWTPEKLLSNPPHGFMAIYGQLLCDAQTVYDDGAISEETGEAYTRYILHTEDAKKLKAGLLSEKEKLSINVHIDELKFFLKYRDIKAPFFDDASLTMFDSDAIRIPTLNPSDFHYPPELDYAIRAWTAISGTEGKGKPKARIKDWLDKNTDISNEAKERISTVANWDKSGGAPKTE